MTHGVGTVDSGEMSRFLCSRLGGLRTSLSWRPVRGTPALWDPSLGLPARPLEVGFLGTRVSAEFLYPPPQLAGRAPRGWQGGAADRSFLGPGAQVLLRLGRQRWKLRGRIESDDSQTWDEEEKAFIPTLHENFEIKVGGAGGGGRAGPDAGGSRGRGAHTHHSALPQVTELRGLSSLAVGAVTCDITDFFTTRPQVIVVDITELGTIKLQLEVLWK